METFSRPKTTAQRKPQGLHKEEGWEVNGLQNTGLSHSRLALAIISGLQRSPATGLQTSTGPQRACGAGPRGFGKLYFFFKNEETLNMQDICAVIKLNLKHNLSVLQLSLTPVMPT